MYVHRALLLNCELHNGEDIPTGFVICLRNTPRFLSQHRENESKVLLFIYLFITLNARARAELVLRWGGGAQASVGDTAR